MRTGLTSFGVGCQTQALDQHLVLGIGILGPLQIVSTGAVPQPLIELRQHLGMARIVHGFLERIMQPLHHGGIHALGACQPVGESDTTP